VYNQMIKNLGKSKFGGWLALNVFTKVDRRIMKWSNARYSSSTGTSLAKNAILLTSIGAKSGQERDTPLFCTPIGDGGDIALIASATGHVRHPAWYYNLKANPDCVVRFRGVKYNAVARLVEGEERQKVWDQAVRQYDGYETYRMRTERVIPVFVLTPVT